MLIVTINEIPGKKLEALGVVRGSTVQSRNLGHDMMAGFRTLVGGEVTVRRYAYRSATDRYRTYGQGRGKPWRGCHCGNAVRLCQRHAGAAEVIAYGTAVKFV